VTYLEMFAHNCTFKECY